MMTEDRTAAMTPFERMLAKVVHVERGEIPALLWSFGTFCAVLCAYYLIRPVRDEVSSAVSSDVRQQLFIYVFLVTLIAVPLFGWAVSKLPRERVLPVVYGVFIAMLLVFWALFRAGAQEAVLLSWPGTGGATSQTLTVAGGFFIWGSVFNLFVVSLFWILMSELYSSSEAKRLYGFIAAGGSTGALLGPMIAQTLATVIKPANLLGLAAVLLVAAMLAAMRLRKLHQPAGEEAKRANVTWRDLIAGAEQVMRSRYLLGIATWVFLANLVDTFFYLEQARIVGEAIPDKAQRVQMFARLDLAVSVLTILIQVFGTGRILERLGVGWGAAALPCVAITGLLAMAVAPGLAVVAAIMVAVRVTAFASASPAVKVLYTALTPEQKFKAQNFIDTVVYRGGDAAAGIVFGHGGKAAAQGAAGSVSSLAIMVLPVAFVWLGLSFTLERHRPKAGFIGERKPAE